MSAYAHETIQPISNYLTLHSKYKAKVPPMWFIHSKNLPFFFLHLFIYFWLCWVLVAAHALSLVTARRGHSLVVHGILITVASLIVEHGL